MSYPSVQVSGVIRLGQFLKFANLADDGAHARELIQEGDVSVNGAVETRRGAQLSTGDIVEISTPNGIVGAQVATL